MSSCRFPALRYSPSTNVVDCL